MVLKDICMAKLKVSCKRYFMSKYNIVKDTIWKKCNTYQFLLSDVGCSIHENSSVSTEIRRKSIYTMLT